MRKKRFTRSRSKPASLSAQDRTIVKHIYECGLLSSNEIQQLTGIRHRQQVNRSLRKLFDAGFLDKPAVQRFFLPEKGNAFDVYEITDQAKALLESMGVPVPLGKIGQNLKKPLGQFQHRKQLSSLLAAMQLSASQADDLALVFPPYLNPITPAGQQIEVPNPGYDGLDSLLRVVPDLIVEIRKGKRRSLLLIELDLGTMPVYATNLKRSSLRKKMMTYHEAWLKRDEVFSEQISTHPKAIKTLFVLPSSERVNSSRETARRVFDEHPFSLKSPKIFLFAEWENVLKDPFGSVWKDHKTDHMSSLI